MNNKKFLFSLFTLILFISFTSAYYRSYYGSSIQDIFYNSSTIYYLLFFIILFGFFNYSLSRIFKENRTTANIISFSLAALILYWFSRSDFSFDALFFNLNIIPENLLFIIVPLLFLVILIYTFSKLKKNTWLLFGILFLILGIFNVVYESLISILLGVLFILIWLFSKRNSKPKQKFLNFPSKEDVPNKPSNKLFSRTPLINYSNNPKLEEKKPTKSQKPIKSKTKLTKSKQRELTTKQRKREKERKKYMKQINQELKVYQKQLRNPDISDHSRRVIEQRLKDLKERKKILKSYGIGKGNL